MPVGRFPKSAYGRIPLAQIFINQETYEWIGATRNGFTADNLSSGCTQLQVSKTDDKIAWLFGTIHF